MIGIEEALREKVPDEALDYCCKLWIDFPFENRTFQDKGLVATLTNDKKGLGVHIPTSSDLSEEKKFKWKSFIKILQDRGLTPSRIK